jgi:proteasome lid subunit RPN8/RPN11
LDSLDARKTADSKGYLEWSVKFLQYSVYIEASALGKAQEHFKQAAGTGVEAMGLLAGKPAKWKGEPYAFCDEYLTAGNSATRVSVKFGEEAFPDLAKCISEARKSGKIMVGWAHAHPGFGCFLSGTDLKTQKAYFNESFSFALVIDPLRNEKQVFKLGGDKGYKPAPYAVVARKS